MTKDTLAARDVALAALNSIEKDQAFSALALQDTAKKYPLSPRDERLVWRLVYGVVTHRLSLDYILNQFCRRNVSSLSASLRNNMRMACYQLVYLDRIPDFAAVNEAVDRARKTAGKGMAGFVNGVLRNILRNRDSLFKNLELGTLEEISVLHSHPLWMVEMWAKRWGLDFSTQLCISNNEPASLTIRVNTRKISVDQYVAASEARGLKPAPGRFHPQALVFPLDTPFSQLPGYKQGWFVVQGEASMLPAACLELEPGQHVLDMCSAPGGKATQIAAEIQSGLVTAWDIHDSRLKLVRANAARLGLENIITARVDAAHAQEIPQKFDRILIDAPCSGFGVIRKKPDIKWSRTPEDIHSLAELQLKILHTGCDLLNPGGILVYSTCTMVEEENQAVVMSLLGQRRDIELLKISMPGLDDTDGFIATFPHLHNLDGFFIAKLTKVV